MNGRTLGTLADPSRHQEPIDLDGCDPSTLRQHLRMMITIRAVERQLAQKREEGAIGGPVHLGVGQEAIATGVAEWLRPSDRVFGGHRSHAHVLAMGASVHGLFSEILGRDTGLSRGMGGSMHLWDGPRGFSGSVPIVAGTVPLAVGAGLAAKLTGSDDVGVAFFGDGAMEEGVAQESLNLARVLDAPVLFVVENNLFASHMQIGLRQPLDSTARFAAANDIPFEVVDGNDVVAVSKAASRLVGRARAGDGPGLLEAVTFRWYGHVDWREDIDVGVHRSREDLAQWKKRDPISRLVQAMMESDLVTAEEHRELEETIHTQVSSAWERATADPWPPKTALLDRVYAPGGMS